MFELKFQKSQIYLEGTLTRIKKILSESVKFKAFNI
jgi:hypothetical protein